MDVGGGVAVDVAVGVDVAVAVGVDVAVGVAVEVGVGVDVGGVGMEIVICVVLILLLRSSARAAIVWFPGLAAPLQLQV